MHLCTSALLHLCALHAVLRLFTPHHLVASPHLYTCPHLPTFTFPHFPTAHCPTAPLPRPVSAGASAQP